MGNYVNQLNDTILDEEYKRELYQSYMTGPEWRNVEMVSEYGAFLKEKKSLFQFPYFRQIAELWRVFYFSYISARQHNSLTEIFFSEYMLMDLFVVFFTTMELIPKGFISLFVSPFLNQENDTQMQQHMGDFYEKYAHDLETIPFFDHDYTQLRSDLAEKYDACTEKTWGDWFSWSCLSMELRAKKWLSIPLRYMLHQDEAAAVVTTDILVKFNDSEANDSPDRGKDHFIKTLEAIAKQHHVSIVGDVQLKEMKEGKSYQSIYARLRVPRYMAFIPLLQAMAEKQIHVRKIAGQDLAQIKCAITTQSEHDEAQAIQHCEAELSRNQTLKPLYSYTDRIHSNYKVCLFEVPVKNLHETLAALEYADDSTQAQATFIHNF